MRRRPKLAGIVGRVGCGLLAAFIVAHGYFLIVYEDAFADGGMIWDLTPRGSVVATELYGRRTFIPHEPSFYRCRGMRAGARRRMRPH